MLKCWSPIYFMKMNSLGTWSYNFDVFVIFMDDNLYDINKLVCCNFDWNGLLVLLWYFFFFFAKKLLINFLP